MEFNCHKFTLLLGSKQQKHWKNLLPLVAVDLFLPRENGHSDDENAVPSAISTYVKFSDLQLLRHYRTTKNARYMSEIYRRYSHLILGSCIKYLKNECLAEDALMELFAKLIVKLRDFTPLNFGGWLYIVTRNHCLEMLRKMKSIPAMESIEIVGFNLSQDEDDSYWERECTANMVEEAIKNLPERQQRCIQLFYIQGNSYQQVAKLTSYSFKEVKSHIQNGRRNLGNYLMKFSRKYNLNKNTS